MKNNDTRSSLDNSSFVLVPTDFLLELKAKTEELIELVKNNKDDKSRIPDWASEKETQQLLGKRTTALWALRKSGKLIASKIGGKVFYLRKSITDLLESNKDK